MNRKKEITKEENISRDGARIGGVAMVLRHNPDLDIRKGSKDKSHSLAPWRHVPCLGIHPYPTNKPRELPGIVKEEVLQREKGSNRGCTRTQRLENMTVLRN
jgi:hypothetical protein